MPHTLDRLINDNEFKEYSDDKSKEIPAEIDFVLKHGITIINKDNIKNMFRSFM